MIKLGDKLGDPGWKHGDDYTPYKCIRCGRDYSPFYNVNNMYYCANCLKDLYQESLCEGLDSWHKSFILALAQAINDKEI
jgi:DNA-directed RNA polymerase subunit RPC12/RpoP